MKLGFYEFVNLMTMPSQIQQLQLRESLPNT